MNVATWQGGTRFTLDDVPEPIAGPGQVVVAVETAGICGTDVHATQGLFPYKPPLVLGHRLEAAGIHLSRVVDEDVGGTEPVSRLPREPLDVGRDRHVGHDREHLASALGGQLVAGLLERGLRPRADGDADTRLQQPARDLAADPARAAGDDRRPALNSEVHAGFLRPPDAIIPPTFPANRPRPGAAPARSR